MTELTDGTIRIRPPVLGDAPAIVDGIRSSLAELEPWMPWASASYDEAAARQWIAGGEEHPFLIVDADGSVVGSCGLNQVDPLNRRANLGYWVRSDRTGRGLATAATSVLAGYGLGTLGLQRLEIVMSVENHASRRVAERVGADHEGILRCRLLLHGRSHDAHSFSLTAPIPSV